MEMGIILLLTFMSFIAGFVDGIAGGGGLILIPSLLLSGMPSQVVLGTNKFAGTCGTAMAAINFIRSGKVIWKIAGFGLVFSFAGSIVGTKTILLVDPQTTAKIILFMLPITAIALFLPKHRLKTSISDFSRQDLYLNTPLLCLAIGFYDGFFGPGTGTFLIFGFYIFLGLDLIQSSAISKIVNLTSNLGSLITFALSGKVFYGVGIPIALANLAGGYLGSNMAIRKGQRLIKIFLLVVFMILFVTLAFRIR